jgi:hypothetical protein
MKLYPFKIVTFYLRDPYTWGSFKDLVPAFPVDTEKNHDTAKEWCNYKDGVTKVLDVNNSFKNLKLLGVEHRGNGGRAYKVLINAEGEDLVVEIRGKVFEDYIINGTIINGIFQGEWKFINDLGASLVPVDSAWAKSYDKFHGNPHLANISKVKVKDIKPMECYKDISRLKSFYPTFSIYLGEASHIFNKSNYYTTDLVFLYANITLPNSGTFNPLTPEDWGRHVNFSFLKQHPKNLYKVPLDKEEVLALKLFNSKAEEAYVSCNYHRTGWGYYSIVRATEVECVKEFHTLTNINKLTLYEVFKDIYLTKKTQTRKDICSTWV